MRFTKQITRFGGSWGFIIDKPLIKKLGLQLGDLIEVEIKKAIIIDTYKCDCCSHFFDSDEEIPYCPVCGKEDCLVKITDSKNYKK